MTLDVGSARGRVRNDRTRRSSRRPRRRRRARARIASRDRAGVCRHADAVLGRRGRRRHRAAAAALADERDVETAFVDEQGDALDLAADRVRRPVGPRITSSSRHRRCRRSGHCARPCVGSRSRPADPAPGARSSTWVAAVARWLTACGSGPSTTATVTSSQSAIGCPMPTVRDGSTPRTTICWPRRPGSPVSWPSLRATYRRHIGFASAGWR